MGDFSRGVQPWHAPVYESVRFGSVRREPLRAYATWLCSRRRPKRLPSTAENWLSKLVELCSRRRGGQRWGGERRASLGESHQRLVGLPRCLGCAPGLGTPHRSRNSYGGRTPGRGVCARADRRSSAGRLDCHAAAARWLCRHRLSLRYGGQRACYRCSRERGLHSTTGAANWRCDFLAGRRRTEYFRVLRQRPTSRRPGTSHPPGRARCGDTWFSELREHWHTGCTAASDQFLGKRGPAPEL